MSKIFLLSSLVSWLSPREEGRLIVRSGEQVRLHEGGESVLWNITGGFVEGLFMDRKGASTCFPLSYFCEFFYA